MSSRSARIGSFGGTLLVASVVALGRPSSAQISLPGADGGIRTPSPVPQPTVPPVIRPLEPAPQGTIEVREPYRIVANEAPHFDGGNEYAISWKATNTTSNLLSVWLTLGDRRTVLSPGTTATSLSYRVPVDMPPGLYELRVSNVRDPRVYGTQTVDVRAPQIVIIESSSEVDSCTPHLVAWQTKGNPGPSTVRVLRPAANGGTIFVQSLGANVPYTSSESIQEKLHHVTVLKAHAPWTTPTVDTVSVYYVDVTSIDWPSIKDRYTYGVQPPKVRSGEIHLTWQRDRVPQPLRIDWSHSPCLASHRVKIEIMDPARTTVLLTASASTPMEPSSLAWSLPAEYCGTYAIRITDLDRPSAVGWGAIHRPDPQIQVHPGPDMTPPPKPSWCKP